MDPKWRVSKQEEQRECGIFSKGKSSFYEGEKTGKLCRVESKCTFKGKREK